jgi:hypothetical protein
LLKAFGFGSVWLGFGWYVIVLLIGTYDETGAAFQSMR